MLINNLKIFYRWDYNIKVKTKEGTFVSEVPGSEEIDRVSAPKLVKKREWKNNDKKRNIKKS